MRLVRLFVTAVLAWAVLATAVWAQNGLERFEREIKPQIQLEKFAYGDSRPLGSAGFVLTDVVAVMPASASTGDKASTLKIDRLTVDALDFDRMKDLNDDEMPRFAKLKIEGMTGDEEMFAALTPYGVPQVPVDVVLDYRLDAGPGLSRSTGWKSACAGRPGSASAWSSRISARKRARLRRPSTTAGCAPLLSRSTTAAFSPSSCRRWPGNRARRPKGWSVLHWSRSRPSATDRDPRRSGRSTPSPPSSATGRRRRGR
jgi:hypothetical protein